MKWLMITAFIASGCGSVKVAPSAADYGPKPSVAESDAAIKIWFRDNLLDPDSVKDFEAEPPAKIWYGGPIAYTYAWGVLGRFNAKNAFGAYAGRKSRCFLIQRDDARGEYVVLTAIDCDEDSERFGWVDGAEDIETVR
jgi:hypothetical protein